MTDASKPWIELGTGLGKVITSLADPVHAHTSISVRAQGGAFPSSNDLEASVWAGLLATQAPGALDLVSAPALAKELGCKMSVSHDPAPVEGSEGVVTVTVSQPGIGPIPIMGTVVAGEPLLTRIERQAFSEPPKLRGRVVVYRGKSDPENIAAIAETVTKAGVSVSSHSVSEDSERFVFGVMHIDRAVTEDVRMALFENVLNVQQIEL